MAIFSAIASIVGGISTFIGGLGAIGSFLLKTAVGLGVSLLGQALAGKQSAGAQNFAINGTLQGGGDLARSFILGRYATAGSLVWVNTWGKDGETPNAYLTQIIALSDLPVAGLDEFWVNGEKVTLGADTVYGKVAVGTYANNLWVSFHDGNQTVADSVATTYATTAARNWAATRIGRGVAYAVVTARVSKNKFSGVPSFKFVLRGLPLYDISKDSTAGGVGAHRWADRSTWGGDGDNLPAVQLYNVMRGLSYNGEWFYGLQNLPAARLPAANWIAQIGKCRATIEGASGLEATYRSGGEISIDAPMASAVEAMLTACQGKIAEVGGVYTLHCGAPDGPVVAFTDDDILSTEEQEFTPFLGLADTINGVSATYPSSSDGWVTKTAPPLYRPDLETEDGNRRLMADVPLDFVPYAEQVQRLMKSALEEARRFRRHTLVLPPKYWAYATPGEVFEWTSVRNGYVNKLMRIDGVADRANLDVMIDITEVDPADYDWHSETDFQLPVDGAVGVIRPDPQPIIDWYAEPWILKDSVGDDRRPAIRLTWDNSDGRLDDVIGIEYEVRIQSSLEKVGEGRTDQPEAGSLITSQGLLPNEVYGVRGRYIPDSGRETLWSGYLLVTTPNIKLGSKDIDVATDLTNLGQDAKEVFIKLGQDINAIWQRLEAATEAFSLNGAVGQIDRETIRAEVGQAKAEIINETRVRVTETEALAAQLIGVSADVNGKFADGLVSFQAVSAPSGVDVRFAVMLRAGDAEEFKSSGFYIEIYTEAGIQKSRMAINVDQFVVTNDTDSFALFAIDEGIVKMLNAKIEQAQIDNLLVGESNIEPGAVNMIVDATPVGGTGPQIIDITVNHGLADDPSVPKRIRIEAKGVFGRTDPEVSTFGPFRLLDITGGAEIELTNSRVTSGQTPIYYDVWHLYTAPVDRETSVFRVSYPGTSVSTWASMQAICLVYKQS